MIPGSEIEEAANAAVAEIAADPASRAELASYGLDEQVLCGVEFSIEQRPGLDPGSVVILILIAAAGRLTADGILALWSMVLHRIRKSKGYDALGEELMPR